MVWYYPVQLLQPDGELRLADEQLFHRQLKLAESVETFAIRGQLLWRGLLHHR